MKVKSRGAIVSVPFNGGVAKYMPDNNSSNGWRMYEYFPYLCTRKNGFIETISYDDTIRSGKVKYYRYCLHETSRYGTPTVAESHYLSLTSPNRTEALVAYPCEFDLVVPNVSPLHIEALNYFAAGCVEQSVQLPVNVIEFKEIPSYLKSLPQALKNLKMNSKSIAKFSSGQYLAYQFGIAPLISDVKSSIESLRGLANHLKWLRAHEGKPVRVRYRKDISANNTPSTTFMPDATGTGQIRSMQYRAVYTATAVIVYDVSGLTDLEIKTRTLLRSFGFDDPLGVVWELIPYSFIIDWFFKVGKFLESFSPKITLPYKIIDSGWSIKIVDSRIQECYRYRPYKTGNPNTYGQTTKTYFRREPGLPISFSILESSPGLHQLALSLALAVQRIA